MNKLFVFIAVFGLAFGAVQLQKTDLLPSAGINDQILKLIENFKQQMPCGIPDLGVPILAPLKQEFLEINLTRKLFEIMINLFDIQVDGLNDFTVNSISLNILALKFKFDLTFKNIHAKSQYVANLNFIKYLRIKGNGDADINLKDLRLVGEAQIGANTETKDLYLRDFKITMVLGQFKSDITGLLWGKLTGKLANSMIEKAVPYILKYKHDELASVIHDIVTEMANEKLKGVTIKDILDLINNQSDPVECIPPVPENTKEEEIAMAEFKQIVDLL